MNKFITSLSIIIVVYNKAIHECESFRSILEMRTDDSNLDIFVYDNSPVSQKINYHKGITIYYMHDPNNSGVSRAYNEGALYAAKNKKCWVLLLDQDTLLPVNLLETCQKAVSKYPEIKLFVPVLELKSGKIFSPCRYKFKRGFYIKKISEGIHSLDKLSPVNSGMLIDISSFIDAGGYNNNVKLDFGDFQFIERFRKKYKYFYVLDARCIQDFSNDEVSYKSQLTRFKFFCEGARNIEKEFKSDWLTYSLLVGIRAIVLTLKHKKFSFIFTYYYSFLKSK
ncbi:glycosyltransferase [Sediminicola arcticus]|jgi:rhamnosyltransferase|uniref:Glycosyltransferase n=1 Tax=Sediminicola arcticus TaxID=1574308 RepID=A0ABV2SQV6_9FLAO